MSLLLVHVVLLQVFEDLSVVDELPELLVLPEGVPLV